MKFYKKLTYLIISGSMSGVMNEQIFSTLTWDELFMKMVYLMAEKSRDPRTKIGAVLVKDKRVISTAYNGFPARVNDLESRYKNREDKYKFVVHAEDNSILTASRFGISTVGSILYTNGVPCCECAKSVIQGGIEEVVIHHQWPDMTHSIWLESTAVTRIMFHEANVKIRILDCILNTYGFLDGKRISV